MWRTELQEVKEEFQLVQFRLLYPNAGDFAETPVSLLHIKLSNRLKCRWHRFAYLHVSLSSVSRFDVSFNRL